jgi:hypothetical protein
VIVLFKQKNPSGTFFLFIYGILLKFYLFLFPQLPLLRESDGLLYKRFVRLLESTGTAFPALYGIIAYLLLYTQALYFNKILNDQKIFPRATYLPGMAYLLLTSLMQPWSQLSAPLIVNSVFIAVLGNLTRLYNNEHPKTMLFNLGLATGVASFFYLPALALALLIFFALLVMRPFRLNEWLVALLGLLTPYYFLFGYLFFTSQINLLHALPPVSFSPEQLHKTLWIAISVLFIILLFMVGGYQVQQQLGRMLIHVRKTWSLLLFYLFLGIVIPIVNTTSTYDGWILTAVPFTAFHTAAYFYPQRKWLPVLLYWATIGWIICLHYIIPAKLIAP